MEFVYPSFISIILLIILADSFFVFCNHLDVFNNNINITSTPTFIGRLNLIFKGANNESNFFSNGRKNFLACICMSPKEINATLAWLSPMEVLTEEIQSEKYLSKALAQAQVKAIACPNRQFVCRKWKPPENINSNPICYTKNKEEAEGIQEGHMNSCIIIVKGNVSGHSESVNISNKPTRSWSEKRYQQFLMSKSLIVPYPVTPVSSSSIMRTVLLAMYAKLPIETKKINLYKPRTDLKNENERNKRSSTISVGTMLFPHLNRNVMDRKRKKDNKPEISDELPKNISTLPDLDDQERIITHKLHSSERRRKRETHILVARYRSKSTKNSRRKRKKPKPKPSANLNDCDKGVSTTPFTFLNVSFTGYWEPATTTTVKPRVEKPLKTTERDMEFVYQEKQNKGDSGGWSSKLEVTIRS